MRRWLAAGACAVTVLAGSGCGGTSGLDAHLTDDWGAPAAPTGFTPAAGTCHPLLQDPATRQTYDPVDCGQHHLSETVHVGQVAGQAATATRPGPTAEQYRECVTKIDEFLGGSWRTGRIGVRVLVPSQKAWAGGARWFRCDVQEVDIDTLRPVSRTGSLAGALTGDGALRLRCFTPKIAGDDVKGMSTVACDREHHSEFAGIWSAPDGEYASLHADGERIHKGCRSAIARFAKVPDDDDIRYRTGVITFVPEEEAWNLGERGVQCFLWIEEKKLTRSLAGAGTGGLPINYA